MYFVLSSKGITYGDEIATLSLHTVYRITLSCLYKHLLADTFSCMCILLRELCCVLCIDLLLVTSKWHVVQINIWR